MTLSARCSALTTLWTCADRRDRNPAPACRAMRGWRLTRAFIFTLLASVVLYLPRRAAANDPSAVDPPGIDLRAPRVGGFHDPNRIVYDTVRYRRWTERNAVIRRGATLCGVADYTVTTSDGEFYGQTGLFGTYLGTRFQSSDLVRFLDERARREPESRGADTPDDLRWEKSRRTVLRPWDADVASAIELLAGVEAKESVPSIIRLLRDPSPQVRQHAIVACARFGPLAAEAATQLTRFLNTKDSRDGATYALSRIGPAAVPALRAALRDGDPHTRTYAAEALGKIGPAARDAAADLADRLADKGSSSATYAAIALQRIGPAAEPAIPSLVRAVRMSDSHDVREHSAAALSAIGPPATLALVDLLSDADGRVRFTVANAWRVEPTDHVARAALERAAGDDDAYVRKAATESLAYVKSLALAVDASRTGPDDGRCHAIRELARRWPRSRAAEDTLVTLLENPSSADTTAAAAEALGALAGHSSPARAALTGAVNHNPDDAVRAAARKALLSLEPRRPKRVEPDMFAE